MCVQSFSNRAFFVVKIKAGNYVGKHLQELVTPLSKHAIVEPVFHLQKFSQKQHVFRVVVTCTYDIALCQATDSSCPLSSTLTGRGSPGVKVAKDSFATCAAFSVAKTNAGEDGTAYSRTS